MSHCFLFLLEFLVDSALGSRCANGAGNLAPIVELHRALSTSDDVNVSPSALSSYKWYYQQLRQRLAIIHE